jgi:hypothetical protein
MGRETPAGDGRITTDLASRAARAGSDCTAIGSESIQNDATRVRHPAVELVNEAIRKPRNPHPRARCTMHVSRGASYSNLGPRVVLLPLFPLFVRT